MIEQKRADRRQRPKRRWLKVVLGVVAILLLGVGTYVFATYNDVKQTVDEEIYQQVESIDTIEAKEKIEKQVPLNILLLGVDQRPGQSSGRSDAMVVLSLSPEDNSLEIVSIPRDTRTEIIGKGFKDKINHAYAFGGTDMSVATVENLLDIDLDYYVQMNMEGVSEMVDAVGGVTVTNHLDWYDEGYYQKGYHYGRGELILDGPKAMGYIRMRHIDPNGDFGRTQRQRQVLEAILAKGASVGSVNKVGNIVDVLGNNMATNLDFQDMQDLLLNYANVRENISSYMMQGSGTNIDGIYYMQVSDEEIQKVHDMLVKEE